MEQDTPTKKQIKEAVAAGYITKEKADEYMELNGIINSETPQQITDAENDYSASLAGLEAPEEEEVPVEKTKKKKREFSGINKAISGTVA